MPRGDITESLSSWSGSKHAGPTQHARQGTGTWRRRIPVLADTANARALRNTLLRIGRPYRTTGPGNNLRAQTFFLRQRASVR